MTRMRQTWHWRYTNCSEPSQRVFDQLVSSHQSFRYLIARISSTENSPSHIEVFVKFETGFLRNKFPDDIINLRRGATRYDHEWIIIKTVAPVALAKYCQKNGDCMTNLNITKLLLTKPNYKQVDHRKVDRLQYLTATNLSLKFPPIDMLANLCSIQQTDGGLNKSYHLGIHETKQQAQLKDFTSPTDNLVTIKNLQAQPWSIQKNTTQQKADHVNQEIVVAKNFNDLQEKSRMTNEKLAQVECSYSELKQQHEAISQVTSNQINLQQQRIDYQNKFNDMKQEHQSVVNQLLCANDALQNARTELDSKKTLLHKSNNCLLYTSPSPRDLSTSRMPSSA